MEKEVQAGRCTEGRDVKEKQRFAKTDPHGTWNPHTVRLRHRLGMVQISEPLWEGRMLHTMAGPGQSLPRTSGMNSVTLCKSPYKPDIPGPWNGR